MTVYAKIPQMAVVQSCIQRICFINLIKSSLFHRCGAKMKLNNIYTKTIRRK